MVSQCPAKDAQLKATGQLRLSASLGSFFIIEAADKEEAVRIASLLPVATLGEQAGWGIEVHPIGFFEQYAGGSGEGSQAELARLAELSLSAKLHEIAVESSQRWHCPQAENIYLVGLRSLALRGRSCSLKSLLCSSRRILHGVSDGVYWRDVVMFAFIDTSGALT